MADILHLTKPYECKSGTYLLPIHTEELRRMLGLPKKLTVSGLNPTKIGDTYVYVLSQEEARQQNPKSSRPHRIIAICSCGEHVPAGRLQQHRKSHKEVK